MALDTVLFVSKRLQVVAAAILCLMLAQLVTGVLQPSSAAAVTQVRQKISPSQTDR